MRIVHLSDIHLSSENYDEFHDKYLKALILDLEEYHSIKYIDLIIITGDLVDKGGHSLLGMPEFSGFTSPYDIFHNVFIKPIALGLGLKNENFLFIPGNHDVDENEILWVDEKKLKSSINSNTIKEQLQSNKTSFNYSNNRIKAFKNFEKKFHLETSNYVFSNNESTFYYQDSEGNKVGFILVNDSWRCSTCLLREESLNNHYFGKKQLYWAIDSLESKYEQLDLIVCLFHHAIDDFTEKDDVESFLINRKIDLLLFGHHHSNRSEKIFNPLGKCLGFRGRAALNEPNEPDIKFKPGYQIIDIDFYSNRINQINHRIYISENESFVPDVYWCPPDGIDKNKPDGGRGYQFTQREKAESSFMDDLDVNDFRNTI